MSARSKSPPIGTNGLATPAQAGAASATPPRDRDEPVILLVDDRPEDLDVLEIILDGIEGRLLRASSGEQALRILLQQDVALVVTDVRMPGLDGLELAALLRQRERTRHVPVLLVTAHHQDELRLTRAHRLKVVDIVSKPLDRDAVRAKAEVFIDLHRLRVREREAARQLAERADQAERSNADLALFAHVAAHDMQEPLSTVSRHLRLLEGRLPEDLRPELREHVVLAAEEVRRLRALLSDVLEYATIPAHAPPRSPVSLAAALERARRALRDVFERTGGTLAAGPLPEVSGDEGQLVRLFQNLLGNALKFRGENPPEIHVSCESNALGHVISVRDNGLGVPEEARARIFDLFERVHPRAEHPGTGLGLSICRRIVEGHGGRIWVDPAPGGGAIFRFLLPASGDHAQGRG